MKNTVIGIVFSEDRREVLVTKRRDVPIWVFPSGGIEDGEPPEEAVVREVLEETHLTVRVVRQTGEYAPINRLARLTRVYECEVVGGTPGISDETLAVRFCPIDALPKSLLFLHREWLDDAMKGSAEPVRRPIANVTYWELVKYFFRHPIIIIRALLGRFGIPFNTAPQKEGKQ